MMSNIKKATSLVWIISCLLNAVLTGATFLFLVDQDRWGPEGFSSGFTISEVPQDVSTEQLIQTLKSTSTHNDVNVYKVTPSSTKDSRTTEYYLFEGAANQVLGDVESRTFPTFAWVYQATLNDATEIKREQLTGTYLVQGSSATTQNILSSLADLKIIAREVSAQPGYLLWGFFLIGNGWGTAAIILGLLLLLALCQLQSVRLSVVAVRLSSGDSNKKVCLLEAFSLITPIYIPLLASTIALVSYSLLISGGYRLLSISMIALQQFVIITALVIISTIAMTIFSSRQSLGELIKGKRPETLLSTVSATLIIVATLGVSGAVSNAWQQAQDYGVENQADAMRLSQPNLVQPVLGYALQSSQATEIQKSLGNIFIDLEQTEKSFLAEPNALFDAQEGGAVPANNMAVNIAYLSNFTNIDKESIQTVSQLTTEKSSVVVLIPSQYASAKDAIRASVESWAQFQHNTNNPDKSQISVETITNLETGVVPLLYFDVRTKMYMENPVLIVINSESDVLPPEILGTLKTVYQADAYQTAVTAHNLNFAVIGYDYLAQQTQLEKSNRSASLIIVLIGVAVALGALILGIILLVRVYESRNRAAIFLQLTSGATFTEIHANFLNRIFILAIIPLSISVAISSLPTLPATLISLNILLIILLTGIITLRITKNLNSRLALEIS